MSQFILIKGFQPDVTIKDVKVRRISHSHELFNKVCEYYWKDWGKDDVWEIKSDEYFEIDNYFTQAQEELQCGVTFCNTRIYNIVKNILGLELEVIFWYSEYYDNLPVVHTVESALQYVFKGIMVDSGMCEVYLRYLPNGKTII